MGCAAVLVALALVVVLVKLLPVWVAIVVGILIVAVVIDRLLSGPDRRVLRTMRKVLAESKDRDGRLLACLPVTIAGSEHPPRAMRCTDCRAETLERLLTGQRRLVAVVTSGGLSFWSPRGRAAVRVASYPFGQLRGLKQIEGAYSLLGQLRRSPFDPDRMPLKSASQHKFMLLFDDFSGLYLRARVRWDAAMFHEAYSIVAGNVTMQALSLLAWAELPPQELAERLGLKPDSTVPADLRRRGLVTEAGTITDYGVLELVDQWIEAAGNLRFIDPTEAPEGYRRT